MNSESDSLVATVIAAVREARPSLVVTESGDGDIAIGGLGKLTVSSNIARKKRAARLVAHSRHRPDLAPVYDFDPLAPVELDTMVESALSHLENPDEFRQAFPWR